MGSEEVILKAETLKIFEHKNVPRENILPLIKSTRERALKSHYYRSIDTYDFIFPRISLNPFLKKVIKKKPILDVGCSFGVDLRYLETQGVNPTNLYGVEKNSDFLQLGFDLFGDYSNGITFYCGDILHDTHFKSVQPGRKELILSKTELGCVHSGSLLHLLTRDEIKQFFAKAYQSLSSGGFVIGRTASFESTIQNPSSQMRTVLSQSDFESLLQSSGFVEIESNLSMSGALPKKGDDLILKSLHFIAMKE